MVKTGYGLYNGAVYKRVPEATVTYVYNSTVKNFLLDIMDDVEMADCVTNHFTQLRSLLSESSCRLIKPIQLDFNFVEVNHGYFFNIQEKKFEINPATLKGSPRTFISYDYTGKTPFPKYFVDGNDTF